MGQVWMRHDRRVNGHARVTNGSWLHPQQVLVEKGPDRAKHDVVPRVHAVAAGVAVPQLPQRGGWFVAVRTALYHKAVRRVRVLDEDANGNISTWTGNGLKTKPNQKEARKGGGAWGGQSSIMFGENH